MNYTMVDEDVRRRNSRAVRKRDEWRVRYHYLQNTIKLVKFRLQNSSHGLRENQIMLTALRSEANRLMILRDNIGSELKTTSYPYAHRTSNES